MPEPREIDVAHVARLARLDLTPEETRLYQKQLEQVLDYASKLREADTSGVETIEDAETIPEVLRTDEPRDWLGAQEALSNAPRQANDLFIVPKVVE